MTDLPTMLNALRARIEIRDGKEKIIVPGLVRLEDGLVAVGGETAQMRSDGTWTETVPALRVVPPRPASDPLRPRAALSPGLQPDLGPLLDCIRARGWRVAAHNDYERDGGICSAWLFVDAQGRHVRADGADDLEALVSALEQVKELEESPR